MPPIRCEVLRRDGPDPLPCLVRTDDGRTLRLYGDDALPTARWLGTLAGAPVWAVRADEPPDASAVPEEVLVVDTETFDEVGVEVGPEEDGMGLFDTARTDRSLTGEPTSVAQPSTRPEHRRTAILAWIASTPGPEPSDLVAEPCAPLKQLIADESLDPLPALDGGPRRAAPPVAPPPTTIEPEDTATQFDVPETSQTVSAAPEPSPPWSRWWLWLPVVAVVAAVMWAMIQQTR